MTIWTVGHSTRTFDDFIEMFRSQQIEVLADVRRFPGSRRYPHFDQDYLANALPESGAQYHHFPSLGGRRKPVPDSRNGVWRHPAFRAYADYMESTDFAEGLAALMDVARQQRTAMMCSEAVWWRCHRALIADVLKARGWTVLHIFSATVTQEHPYTSAARLENGRLTYNPSNGQRPAA